MAIVGFNFTKISAEKTEDIKGKISINNNISIKDISEANIAFGSSKQNALKFKFSFITKYEPELGNISLEGDVIFIGTDTLINEVMQEWKQSKKIPESVSTSILGTILEKCNIESVVISREINLPAPIPLPKIQKGEKPQEMTAKEKPAEKKESKTSDKTK